MDTRIWILIIVAAIAVVAAIGFWFAKRGRQRRALRERFGPEYDCSVESARSRRKAEGELAERAEQRDRLDIRPLPDDSRQRYVTQWSEVERPFVDRPQVAVVEADDLVTELMRERGYPQDFESQSKLISVDHPEVVQKYRAAQGVHARTASGDADTEELRRAVVAYRELFEELSK